MFLLLGGCAYRVAVRHYSAPNRLSEEQLYRSSRIYLVFRVPPLDDPEKSSLEKALDLIGAFLPKKTKERYERPLIRGDLDELARRVSQTVRESGNQIIAYQVAYSSSPPLWMREFSPTGSLWITPSDCIVHQESYEMTVKTEEGEKKVRKYKTKIELSVDWKFYGEPEHALLAEGSVPGYGPILEQERDNPISDLEDYLNSIYWDLATKFMKPLQEEILPHEVTRWRTIVKGKSTPMSEAYGLAQNKEWGQAEKIWKEAMAQNPESWEPRYNLAILREKNSEWNEARQDYGQSLERTTDPKIRQRIEKILKELGRLMSAPSTLAQKNVFPFLNLKIAVLPIANETIDLTAHEYVRLRLSDSLSRSHYSILPLPETDEKLKEKGIQEGGQLNLSNPKALAKHLGADRLLYGALEQFKVVNVGIYYRRQVRLSLKLVDKEGRTVWQNTGQTVFQSGVQPQEAAESFLVNLASTQIEKIAKTYLKEECDETVRRALETLPKIMPQ
ncbi:MAG: DUF799 family lipoprotein [Elusimicrobia bacterium]|nr:DUF799 family lipoprotein [Elusimicrobiota bacterium]